MTMARRVSSDRILKAEQAVAFYTPFPLEYTYGKPYMLILKSPEYPEGK
jgi:hypothetical protein